MVQISHNRIGTLCLAILAVTALMPTAVKSAATSQTPVDLLRRAMKSMVCVSYRAAESVTISNGGRKQTQKARILHSRPDNTSWTYLSTGNRVERIVVDSNRTHWQYIPRTQQLIFSPSLPTDQDFWQEASSARLLGNYDVTNGGVSTITGRRTRLLVMTPRKNHFGPTKKLWTDAETGIVLCSKLESTDKSTIIASRISDLKIEKSISPREFATPKAKKQTVIKEHSMTLPLPSLARQWKHPLLLSAALPNGYVLDGAKLMTRQKRDFVHLRYSDGLNAISLFEETAGQPKSHKTSSRVQVHGSPVTWRTYPPFYSLSWYQQGLKLTLITDLPKSEMLRMANSMKQFGH